MGLFDFFRSKSSPKKAEPAKPQPSRSNVPAPVSARVLSVTRETPTVVSFEISEKWQHAAGQFVLLRPNANLPWRAYSFSSAPNKSPSRLTVKAVPGGQVSPYLCAQIAANQTLEVKGPYGQFVLPASFANALFIAGGSGVTPFLSMLHDLASKGWPARVTLLDFNRTVDEQILRSEIDALSSASNGKFEVVHVLDATVDGVMSHPTNESVTKLLAGRAAFDLVAMCGPQPLMDLARTVATAHSPKAQLLEEKFSTVHEVEAGGADVDVEVVQAGIPTRFRVQSGEAVLMAARRAGLDLPSGCEAGACGACRVKVMSGKIDVPEDACLTDGERADGFALICVGTVKAACKFKPDV